MEIYVSEQLRVFLLSVCLGFGLGGLYDMVGAIRTRWAWLTMAVDAGYCLWVALCLFLFTLRQAQGQLRLFVVLGALGGATVFFTGLSGFLRPVWAFWLDSLVHMCQLLIFPISLLKQVLKFFWKLAKNLFYFRLKYDTMRYHYFIWKKRGDRSGKENQT